MKNIAIFASGEGTNAQNIIDYFKKSDVAKVALVVSNNPKANVLNRALHEGVPTAIVERNAFYESDALIYLLKSNAIDLIVLAGFLWKIPSNLIQAFPNKIVNIHPSLLPKFGGKGMYGMNVHKAVVSAYIM
jgi:phosphoribosylglycinamide formyltransferase-1